MSPPDIIVRGDSSVISHSIHISDISQTRVIECHPLIAWKSVAISRDILFRGNLGVLSPQIWRCEQMKEKCKHMDDWRINQPVIKEEDGYAIQGCCGGGCCVITGIKYCPFCGKKIWEGDDDHV